MARHVSEEKERLSVYTPGDDYPAEFTADKAQIEVWDEVADEMGVSRSQALRLLIQAGMHNLQCEPANTPANQSQSGITNQAVRSEVRAAVEGEPVEFDDLVEAVAGDLEEQIARAVEELTESGVIAYRPGKGLVRDE